NATHDTLARPKTVERISFTASILQTQINRTRFFEVVNAPLVTAQTDSVIIQVVEHVCFPILTAHFPPQRKRLLELFRCLRRLARLVEGIALDQQSFGGDPLSVLRADRLPLLKTDFVSSGESAGAKSADGEQVGSTDGSFIGE